MSSPPIRLIAQNRRARHEFELIDIYEAGLVLLGTEVKSLRAGQASMAEAYVRIEAGEAFLTRANIPIYPQANLNNHAPTRTRKLLLSRQQIRRLNRATRERGLTIVPLRLYFKGSWVKLEIATARGRKQHDRRHHLKQQQDRRDMDRARRRR